MTGERLWTGEESPNGVLLTEGAHVIRVYRGGYERSASSLHWVVEGNLVVSRSATREEALKKARELMKLALAASTERALT